MYLNAAALIVLTFEKPIKRRENEKESWNLAKILVGASPSFHSEIVITQTGHGTNQTSNRTKSPAERREDKFTKTIKR